jgi:hypothetical protein
MIRFVPRRGTISLAVGETYGKEARIIIFRPQRGQIVDPLGVGMIDFVAAEIPRFHLRLMKSRPFGACAATSDQSLIGE